MIESPVDALKDPYLFDFLDLPDSAALHESDLEAAILHKLRSFLLKLGKGFAFVARQQRLSFENEQIFAARYVQILPSVEELQRELEQQRRRLDQRRGQ